jgi:hypothetical protein
MEMSPPFHRSVALAFLALVCGCGGYSPSEPSPPADELRGGVLATFTVGPEQFKVWITNSAAIERVLALRAGGEGGGIPNGKIHRGNGHAGHNAPFSWHLDPDDIQVVDVAIELCDGRPSYVEQHVAEYVDTINRYCPWGAKLSAVQDYR